MRRAAQGGHVDVMEVLHARGVLLDDITVMRAAAAGHLPAVAWLVERLGAGAALTIHVFAAAARAGSMELLGWLRARDCPWDEMVFAAARSEQLEWLVEQGCLVGDDSEPYIQAAYQGDLAMLCCLRRLGCPWRPDGSRLTRAAALMFRNPHVHGEPVQRVLSWLLDEGCPVDWKYLEAAAKYIDNEGLMGWLQAQRKQWAHVGSNGLRP
ncbi:hypothetical protein TSOC_014226 [Tetrabaena socialis]|uniref:Ankyrin repeat domain-containing protein n=1 Tax=Tetrabaena socialis TaxID=47790 RepID=A0A2J7ZI88_9CHLO|nr:hypothetical protein TSOC_014226 [Tetrabaena socialis]|eukprot:PNG99976.1 hypothetical protein TSOC_014226 [Tetrabaena socialis]